MQPVGVLGLSLVAVAACAARAPVPATRPALATGQEDECAITRCRPAFTFRVADNDHIYVVEVPPSPYAGDGIAVYPGDDFFVAADERDGVLGNFRYIDPPREPKDVIHVQFAQQRRAGRYVMVLTIQTFFPRRLIYHALGNHPARPPREYFKISTCPLGSMMRMIEIWPNPISFLKLTDFRFSDGNEGCTYY